MFSAFTRHPHQQGMTYAGHWAFAMGIAWRLLSSVVAFATHAILPFVAIDRHLDLGATAAFLNERNRFIENAAAAGRTGRPGLPAPAMSGARTPALYAAGTSLAVWVAGGVLLFMVEWSLFIEMLGRVLEWLPGGEILPGADAGSRNRSAALATRLWGRPRPRVRDSPVPQPYAAAAAEAAPTIGGVAHARGGDGASPLYRFRVRRKNAWR